jgi:adenylate cyclase class 2
MSFEVEVKFRVGEEQVGALVEGLLRLGAVDRGESEQSDAYLRHPSRDFAATNEAFRIRSGGGDNALTYKGPRREGPAKTREEIEIGLAPGTEARDGMRTMLERLGFTPVATVRKRRHLYEVAGGPRPLLVALDRAEGVGTFVEVEALVEDEADLPEAQRDVLEFGHRLGLREVEPRSYLRMVLEASGAIPASPNPGR